MFSSVRAVLFDVDFTLIYPGPLFQAEGYRAFCARHGVVNCDPARFHDAVANASALLDASDGHAYDARVFVRYIRHIIEEMGGSGGAIDECALDMYREWAACRHFSLYDDVVPTLRALRRRRYRLGLVSNTHRSLDAFRSHFELDELISGAVSSSDHGFNKPHPSIFRAALQLLDVEPGQALMVGDNYRHDIEGAMAVGMHGVLLRRAGARLDGAGDCGDAAVPVIAGLQELPGLLLPANDSGRP